MLADIQPLLPDDQIDIGAIVGNNPLDWLCRLSDGRLGIYKLSGERSETKVWSFRSRSRGYLQTTVDDRLQVQVRKASVVWESEGYSIIEKGTYKIRLELRNVSSEELKGIDVRPAGWRLVTSSRHGIDKLGPGESRSIVLEYTSASDVELNHLDPIWDENVPVSAEIEFRTQEKCHSASVPVDYQFYAGWYYGVNGDRTHMAMAYADQPGLMRYVEGARKNAEADYGFPLDDTPAARITAAKAVSTMLRRLGLTYEHDAMYLRDERAINAYAQFPTETLYYGGDCEDFSILYGFFMHELGIPFAIAGSLGHSAPMVELHRGEKTTASIPKKYGDLVVSKKCGDEECLFLPVDPTIGVLRLNHIRDDNEWFFMTVKKARAHGTMYSGRVTTLTTSTENTPEDVGDFGISWLGAMTFMPEKD
jgi:hypothetical protein